MDPAERDARMQAYLGLIAETVLERGWALQGVFPTVDDPDPVGFIYTVGLARRELPELIVFGLHPDTGGELLNGLAEQLTAGVTFPINEDVHKVVRGYPVRLLTVRNSREHLTIANRLVDSPVPVWALQLVYPDPEGRWPWQPGSGVAHLPVLGRH